MKRVQRVSLCRQKSRFLARRPPQTDMLFEYAAIIAREGRAFGAAGTTPLASR
jgi:hypothetical protein